MALQVKEHLQLIAERVPPGDQWELTEPLKDGVIYRSLTEVLNTWYLKTKEKAEFRLSPLEGKVYVIREEEVKIEVKTYDIYGESY